MAGLDVERDVLGLLVGCCQYLLEGEGSWECCCSSHR